MATTANKTPDIIASSLLGTIIIMVMIFLSVYLMSSYGAILFIATPVLAAAASAFYYTRRNPGERRAAIGTSFLSLLPPAALLLALGLEGLICIAMALLPAAFLMTIGADRAHGGIAL